MRLLRNRDLIRWVIIVSSFVIISLILWNTYAFFQKFKKEEQIRVETWSIAQIDLLSLDNLEEDVNPVTSHVLTEMTTGIPMFVVYSDGELGTYENIEDSDINTKKKLKGLINKFSNQNQPIDIKLNGKVTQTIYYGNSPLLNKLKYYPLALLLIILLFAGVVYFFYRSTKTAEQNKLWTGMAKETAHQIGTPLSSLVGWTEILKSENINTDYLHEIEKDVNRLKTITDRFSKIGSIPKLTPKDIVAETDKAIDYLESRTSKLINYSKDLPTKTINVALNEQLYSWTIENLVKNAIDAMKGKGNLKITVKDTDKLVQIQISDTGKGISKHQFTKIFEPGYTTKKRGWGLGLSLTKRIIEDYHNGKIKVLRSEVGIGSTFQIILKKAI